jgi:hypothetical protein
MAFGPVPGRNGFGKSQKGDEIMKKWFALILVTASLVATGCQNKQEGQQGAPSGGSSGAGAPPAGSPPGGGTGGGTSGGGQ